MPPGVNVYLYNPSQLARTSKGVDVQAAGEITGGPTGYPGWTVRYSTSDGDLSAWQGVTAQVQADGTFQPIVNVPYGQEGRILVQAYDGNGGYQGTSEARDVNETPSQ